MTDPAATFRTTAEAYDSHIGRYGPELARLLIDFAGVGDSGRVLDVGCGTGMLTAALPGDVAAVDPSPPYVDACRRRVPTADVRVAPAEQLPFDDGSFDAVLSQLVVNFMSDPLAGVREMGRVAKPGAVIAACVWDYAGEMKLLRAFWEAAVALDPAASGQDEANMPHCTADALGELWQQTGLHDVRIGELWPAVRYQDFDDLWAPLTSGVAPSGAYTFSLDPPAQDALRAEFHRRLGSPEGPFDLAGRAWAVAGRR